MFSLYTPRSSRFLLKTTRNDYRITTRVIFPVSTKNSDQQIRNFSISRSKLLNDSLSKTQKLQKSLDSIRVKKQETEGICSKITVKRLKKLRAKVDIARVNLKFHRAALKIQKNFRGFLIRRQFRAIISNQLRKTLQAGIKNLEVRVEDIWSQTESLNKSAKVIQVKFREFLKKKNEKISKKVLDLFEKNLKNSAARRIQKFFRLVLHRVRVARIEEHLRRIKENLKILRLKNWWNSHKFAWKTIRKHYGMQDDDSEAVAKIVIITPTSSVPVRVEVKSKKKVKKNKRNKLKPKTVKSNLATSSSALSPKPESENLSEKAENTLNSEEESKNQLGIPFDRIKKLFNDLDLEENEKNELLNEIEETSIYKNTPTPVLPNLSEKIKAHQKSSSSVPSQKTSKRAKKLAMKDNKRQSKLKGISKNLPIPAKY